MDRRNFFKNGVVSAAGFSVFPAALLSLAGCRKDLLDTSPFGSVSSANMWTTDNLTDLGMAGVYETLRLGNDYRGSVVGIALYTMDANGFTGQCTLLDTIPLMMGTCTTSDSEFSSNWQDLYEGIQRTNDAIANIPKKSPSSGEKKSRYVAESKVLRAYFYFSLNRLYKGVPVYLEPIAVEEATKPRETEDKVWDVVIGDLTDAINEPNLPDKYAQGDADYGHITKGAAYALRGKAYLYMKKWKEAAADFSRVKAAGYKLFPDYGSLFTVDNEQCDEMIFTVQNLSLDGYGSKITAYVGSRSTLSGQTNFFVSPNLVDLYENQDGSAFNWDDIIPGYNSMAPDKREVFFLRDGLTGSEIKAAEDRGLDMSLYLPDGNEDRIRKAYQGRDERLSYNVITPYASIVAAYDGKDHVVTSRWPYRNEAPPVDDLRSNSASWFLYLYRKFVWTGASTTVTKDNIPIDFPIIRYADVLLMWAEAINEQGFDPQAVELVNEVRNRAGLHLLQTTDASKPTYVSGQDDLRERIRNERRVEFPNEGINYFDELRWGTWKDKVFTPGNGGKQVWGSNVYTYSLKGDYITTWPIPQVERERNPKLEQNEGWIG